MEGFEDPFNRRTYPWGHEDRELLAHFRCLGALRARHAALRRGDIQFTLAADRHLAFTRTWQDETVRIYINRSGDAWDIPAGRVLFGRNLQTVAPDSLTLAPHGFCMVVK